MIVAINPGHHIQLDPGAVGPLGVREADVNMSVALKVRNILAAAGHEVHLIHANELYEITDLANASGADVFVSIHCNAAANPAAHGTETFYAAESENGRKLACAIQAEIIAATGLTDRGIKHSPLYVTSRTTMPAALVELAFVSNPHEEVLLASEEWQQKVAEAIARGVLEYAD